MLNNVEMREKLSTNGGRDERRVHFASVGDWMQYLEDNINKASANVRHMCNLFMKKPDHEWIGSNQTGWQLLQAMKAGDVPQEHLDVLEAKLLELPVIPNNSADIDTIQGYHSDSGFAVDMCAYMNGEQFSMIDVQHTTETKPIVWLVVSVAGNANIGSDNFYNRCVALVRVIRTLDAQGISCGIVGYDRSAGCSGLANMHLQTIVIKAPENDINYCDLLHLFASPAVFRTMCFTTETLHNEIGCGSLGGVATIKADDYEVMENSYVSGEMVILGTDFIGEFNDVQRATKIIVGEVQKAIGA